MKNILTYLILLIFAAGCGRDESGYIKNESGKPLRITLKLNDINNDPTKYLVADALNGAISSDYQKNGIDNYFISFDSITNEMILKLGVDEKLNLGTVRLDMTRDSIQFWEFNSITAIGEGININAEGSEIINLVERNNSLFTQNSHCLILKK